MCLPFCCGENDPPQATHDPHTGHGDVQSEPAVYQPSTGKANNGNGERYMTDEDKMAKSPPTPEPRATEKLADQERAKERPEQIMQHTEQVPSPTPAPPQSPSPEHTFRAFPPTMATKAPKKFRHVVASPGHHAGPVAAARAPDPPRTTPPETQIAHRGRDREDDYGYSNPSASPTVLALPAANNCPWRS